MEKSTLRKNIRNLKKQFTRDQLITMSHPVVDRLLCHPKLVQANTIFLYYSLPDEVYTHDIIDELAQKGKKILLPKVIGDNEMEIRLYQGKKSMCEGDFHIMESEGPVFTDYASIDIAVVPGMSFDTEGNRLGRGKGYYDRFLGKVPCVYKIGICFDFQKVDHVPAEPTDIRMDEVI